MRKIIDKTYKSFITILVFLFLYIFYFVNIYSFDDVKINDYLPSSTKPTNDSYKPQVDVILNPPKYIISIPVSLTAKVFDKYGDLKNLSLLYSLDNRHSWKTEKMNLIDGLPNNGTFVGVIPAQKENSTVKYEIIYEDTLNYSSSSQVGEYYVVNHKIIHELSETRPDFPVNVSAYILDKENDINNVTLSFYTNGHPHNISSIEMMQKGDRLFEAEIPSFKENTNVTYYIESLDQRGHHDRVSGSYKVSQLNFEDKLTNPINIAIKDLVINMENQSAKITIDYKAHFNITEEPELSIRNLDLDDDDPFQSHIISLERDDNDFRFFSYIENLDAKDQIFKTILSGDSLRYPFDNYSLNLDFPLKVYDENSTSVDATPIYYESSFNSTLKDSWITKSNIHLVSLTEDFIPVSKESFESMNFSKNSNIKFDFYRNYSIAIIVIPLFSIFFLLGAIFIFENSSDNISNRLTLTLGIFALLFTLPEVIDSMKPQTSAPTIADSMLSIIIIATIAFTISSIISSSSTIQRWFPKHHTWIDGIVFVLVSGFVITYFNKYLSDSQLWWLVPLIIFGLGYGLLLRALGIRINKPLIHFFKVIKKRNV